MFYKPGSILNVSELKPFKNSPLKKPLVTLVVGLIMGSLGMVFYYQPQLVKLEQSVESLVLDVSDLELEVAYLSSNISEKDLEIQKLEALAEALYGNITPDQAYQLLSAPIDAVLIDVRTSEEYKSIHINGSVNIPLHELIDRVGEIDRNSAVIFYCRSGIRSGKAAEFLRSQNYTAVYNLVDGIDGWMDVKYPVQGEDFCPCQYN